MQKTNQKKKKNKNHGISILTGGLATKLYLTLETP